MTWDGQTAVQILEVEELDMHSVLVVMNPVVIVESIEVCRTSAETCTVKMKSAVRNTFVLITNVTL